MPYLSLRGVVTVSERVIVTLTLSLSHSVTCQRNSRPDGVANYNLSRLMIRLIYMSLCAPLDTGSLSVVQIVAELHRANRA